jgi:hypothetical protein
MLRIRIDVRAVPLMFQGGIGSIEAGTDGTVMSIQAHRQRRTLDKYLIRLSSGSEKVFWDIHLKAAVNEGLQ